MKKKVAVIGANGFVGKSICDEINKSENLDLIKITRSDNIKQLIQNVDLVIHSAKSSRRYYANNNPKEDFIDTVEKMAIIQSHLNNRKVILISTISARVQLDTPYGRNRRSCELMLNDEKDLAVRLGPMFGESNHKGALFDILQNKKVYVGESTKYAYTSVKYNAKKIIELIDETGIIEIGAKNAIELGYLKKELNSSSTFHGANDTQILLTKENDAPDAFDVITFAKKIKEKSVSTL